MRYLTLAIAAVTFIGAVAPVGAQQVTTKEQLIGSWNVLSLKATTGNNVAYPLGEKVAGYVTITSDGFGCCSLTRRGRLQLHRR